MASGAVPPAPTFSVVAASQVARHRARFPNVVQEARKASNAAKGSSLAQPGNSFHAAACKGLAAGLTGSTPGQTGQVAQGGQAGGTGVTPGKAAQPVRKSVVRKTKNRGMLNLLNCSAILTTEEGRKLNRWTRPKLFQTS